MPAPEREKDVGASSDGGWRGVWQWTVRDHPIIAGVLCACTVAGAILGLTLLTQEWSAARRIAGGAVAGGGVGLIITATRMFS